MSGNWRRYLGCLILLTAFAVHAQSATANANDYPNKPITIILPYSAGSGLDLTLRRIGESLQKRLGQPIVIMPRPGGSSVIGMNAGAQAAPDGYTLTAVSTSLLSNQVTMKDPQVSFEKNYEPVGLFSTFYLMLVASDSVQAKTVPELVEHAKKNPGTLTFGVLTGGYLEFAKLLFEHASGAKFKAVPYKSTGEMMVDIAGGRLDLGLLSAQQLTDSKLKMLAYLGPNRPRPFPNVASLTEFYPGATLGGWLGIVAPKGTPPDVIEKFNKALAETIKEPEIRKYLLEVANNDIFDDTSPAYMRKILDTDAKIYRDLAKAGGITPN